MLVPAIVESRAQTPAESPEAAANSKLIHYGDLIDVDVVGSFEFDWRGSLNPEGFLDGMDKMESQIFALCRSESDVAAEVEKEYSKILRDPKVVVRILDRSNRAVAYLDGAVRMPQRFQIKRPVRLNELLILSGGITDKASGDVTIFRPEKLSCTSTSAPSEVHDGFVKTSKATGAQTTRIKISDLLRGDEKANPFVNSGDIVTVIEALPIYVIGGVNSPKPVLVRQQMTLSRVIDSAGGLAKDSDEVTVTVYRREGTNTRNFEADLDKIRSGDSEDPVLKPYDIVEVPQKGKPKSRFAPVIETGSRPGGFAKAPLRVID
jgi:protein involved in polysaccharide export with SLBB domain